MPYPIAEKRLARSKASALSLSATVISTFPCSGICTPLATRALYSALSRVPSPPSASPVDFISGPSTVSTLRSLAKENTGAFTNTAFLGSCLYPGVRPWSLTDCPRIARAAILPIATPVILLRKGTVRELRGLTSSTYTRFSLSTINWILYSPIKWKPLPIRAV